MGSEWTDEAVVRRDLSLAQGQWVPCGIDAVVAGEKPPSYTIAEETEEEYYKHWTADGDFSAAPDLSLIKKMLEMMNDGDPEDEAVSPSTGIEIRKVKPIPVPVLKKPPKPKGKPKALKPRRVNVAIASLLAMNSDPIRLCKPEDFITKSEENDALMRKNESVKKVNNWLHSQNSSCMFKKKSNKENEDVINVKNKVTLGVSGSGKSDKKCATYTPSSFAREYYETCVKRSHMQQLVKEDVWARAEKVMKEIDERKAEEIRKQQEVEAALTAALLAAEEAIDQKTEQNEPQHSQLDLDDDFKPFKGIELIELPQHRHQLTEDCIVCEVLLKNPNRNVQNVTSSLETSQCEDIDSQHEANTITVSHGSVENGKDDEFFNLITTAFEEMANTTKDFKENEGMEELVIFG